MTAPESTPSGYANSAEAPPCADEPKQTDNAPPDDLAVAWATIVARWDELREYAGYYIAANVDRLRLTYRTVLMWAILGTVLALAGASVIVAASVLTVIGLANGAAAMVGGRAWAGQLLVGTVILAAASGGVWLVMNRKLRTYRRALVKKYEIRKQRERATYGTDVGRRAESRPKNV